jgi:hypothetical protein
MAGLGIKIRIAYPAIHRPVPDADIGQTGRVVSPDRYIPGNVGSTKSFLRSTMATDLR